MIQVFWAIHLLRLYHVSGFSLIPKNFGVYHMADQIDLVLRPSPNKSHFQLKIYP